jgi:hypothetical protein
MASIVKLSSFSLERVGRTVLSGAGAPNAEHKGLSEGAPGTSPGDETSGPGEDLE